MDEYVVGVYEVHNDKFYQGEPNELIWTFKSIVSTDVTDNLEMFLESLPEIFLCDFDIYSNIDDKITELETSDFFEELFYRIPFDDGNGFYHVVFVKVESGSGYEMSQYRK